MMLKKSLRLGNLEFCAKADISTATLHNIVSGINIRPKTVRTIATNLNVDSEWIFTGKGDMFIPEQKDAKEFSLEVEQLKQENARLQKEIDRLWQLIGHDRKLNFLNALDVADAKIIPLRKKVAYSGAIAVNQ